MSTSVYPVSNKIPRNPCEQALDIVVYYDGSAAYSPVNEQGLLKLVGGKASVTGQGIGYSGSLTSSQLNIPISAILDGGSGVKVRSCLTRTKKKYRMKCCASTCNSFSDVVTMEVKPISTCDKFFENDFLIPVTLSTSDVCNDDCCEKVNNIVAALNRSTDFSDVAVATAVNFNSTEWAIEIEAVSAATNFVVRAVEGFTDPELVVPFVPRGIYAKDIPANQATILGACDADKCLPAIQIFFYQQIGAPAVGGATSNPVQDNAVYRQVLRNVTVLFNPDDADAVNTQAALTTVLNSAGKMAVTTSADIALFTYCIVRTDAGDATALTTVRSDYTGELSINRFQYAGGKSYYTYTGTSGTAPTPVSSDVVRVGACDATDLPCTSSSPCA